jgi:hypothetical protein
MTIELEHLRKIDAHLEKLLAQAEKRTSGRWVEDACCCYAFSQIDEQGLARGRPIVECSPSDVPFIASCAGNAEAGWKAIRAAIAGWLSLYKATEGYADGAPDASAHDKLCNEVASLCRTNLRRILAAFPLEHIEG